MHYLQQILFLLTLGAAVYILVKRIRRIKKNIALGRPQAFKDHASQRWKTMLLVAFGQKKMFKRIVPAFLHFLIYAGFLIINIEVLEFVLDGILGTHRLFASFLGGFYTFAINFFEFMAVAVIFSCILFLIRRNMLKIKRFTSAEMTSWPRLDANLILVIEIILMLAILTMNAADQVLQTRDAGYTATGAFVFSGILVPLFEPLNTGTLFFLERFTWWFHIVGILGFAVYITYSKHLHIFMAFPNTYYSNLNPKGKMYNMPEITREVKMMMGVQANDNQDNAEAPARFGAKDIGDLTWKNLMEAYACTECGRCTSECPANLTGKKLSPRKIMMDTRDRAEEVGNSLQKGGKGLDDGKSLLGDYITKEELNACTTCNACVEACPVNIDPLSIILQMRRYIVMEESGAPAPWNAMFSNVETSFSPWKFPSSDRFVWADELKNQT